MHSIYKVSLLTQLVFIITTPTVIFSETRTCIPEANDAVYKELKCTPVQDTNSDCIASYDCSHLFKPDRTKCYYQGKAYSIGEKLTDLEKGSCFPVCICENITGEVQFLCSKLQCEEHFTSNNSCLYTYSKDDCCAVMEYCGDEKVVAENELAVCAYKDTVKLEGEYIEESCRRCLCEADFDSKNFDPLSCDRIPCEIEKKNSNDIQNYCAPVYFSSDDCCPTFWYCSNKTEEVITDTETKTYTDEKCTFGELKLETNQNLTNQEQLPFSQCLKCSCILPPLLTCIIDTNCEYNLIHGVLEDRSRRNYLRRNLHEAGASAADYYNYH